MELEQVAARPFGLLKALRDLGLELIFPATCPACAQRLGWRNQWTGATLASPAPLATVCAACWSEARLIQQPICLRCGHPLSGDSDSDSFFGEVDGIPSEKRYCSFCLPQAPLENLPAFAQARSIFYYEGTIRHLIHAFKYRGKISVGKFLGRSMVNYWEPDSGLPAIECIVPVPVGIKKLRRREFNQSLVLAREIGKKLKVPVYPFALKRVKEVAPQMKLSRQERLENIRDAFRLREGRKIQSKRVLLVDDVFTTGATASECSRILLQYGGASEVRVLTLARSVLHEAGK
jgi:ComF family protein